MKKSKLFLIAVICMMTQSISAIAQDTFISTEQLSATIKDFVRQNFPGQIIEYANIEADSDDANIEICLNNGIEIDFDMNENWERVDCYYMSVPRQLIPDMRAIYVDSHFSGEEIVKIDKEIYGYEIELSNGLELKFNHQGELLYIDD